MTLYANATCKEVGILEAAWYNSLYIVHFDTLRNEYWECLRQDWQMSGFSVYSWVWNRAYLFVLHSAMYLCSTFVGPLAGVIRYHFKLSNAIFYDSIWNTKNSQDGHDRKDETGHTWSD